MSKTGSNFGRLAPDLNLTIKDRPVSSRIDGDQADHIEVLADASNMTMSTYLRMILQKAIDEQWVYTPSPGEDFANENSSSVAPKRRAR